MTYILTHFTHTRDSLIQHMKQETVAVRQRVPCFYWLRANGTQGSFGASSLTIPPSPP